MIDFKKQGKKNKASGAKFELEVRKDLENKGWIVAKWSNNVEWDITPSVKERRHLISAKRKFNPFNKVMMMSGGFPDFIVFKRYRCGTCEIEDQCEDGCGYEVIGVEVKTNGYLKPEEKSKCKWLIDNNIFSKILIASKDYSEEKNKRKKKEVIYEEFNK